MIAAQQRELQKLLNNKFFLKKRSLQNAVARGSERLQKLNKKFDRIIFGGLQAEKGLKNAAFLSKTGKVIQTGAPILFAGIDIAEGIIEYQQTLEQTR